MARKPNMKSANGERVPQVVPDKLKQLRNLTASQVCSLAFHRYMSSTVERTRNILGAALGIALFMNVYQVVRPIAHDYIFADRTGRIVTMYALDKPNLSDSDVAAWATEIVCESMTFDYVNWRSELERASHGFTKSGWDAFQSNLETSQLLQTVIGNEAVLTTKPTSSPQLTDNGLMNGVYAWRMKIPIQWEIRSHGANGQSKTETKNLIASVTIVRQPEVSSEKGVAIAKIMLVKD